LFRKKYGKFEKIDCMPTSLKQELIDKISSTEDEDLLQFTRHSRLYYRIKGTTIEIVNMYDTRINPKKNPYLKK